MLRYVDGDGPPPPDLELSWMCERWEALPERGAVMDQSYPQLNRMAVSSNVHRVVTRTRGLVGRQIHNLSDSERRILRTLKDMRLL